MPAGDTALLVELADLDEVLSLYARLDEDLPDGVVDMVPAAATLLLTLDPARTDEAVRLLEAAHLSPEVAA